MPLPPMLFWLASINVIVSGRGGSCEMWFSRITSSSSSARPANAFSSMLLISLAVKSILLSLSGERRKKKLVRSFSDIVTRYCHHQHIGHLRFTFTFLNPPRTSLVLYSNIFIKKGRHTHESEVRLVDLSDSVVACVEMSGVFGKRWYGVQP